MSRLTDLYAEKGIEIGQNYKDVILPSGLAARVREGTAKDTIRAGRIAGKDAAMSYPALMSLVVTIEGRQFTADEFKDLPRHDFEFLYDIINGTGGADEPAFEVGTGEEKN